MQMAGNEAIAGVTDQDYDLNRVLLQSMQEQKNNVNSSSYEPLNPEQRKREEGVPCGLKNIGNTCYFNSLLQVYYNLPRFVREVLEFVDDGQRLAPPSGEQAAGAGQGGQAAGGNAGTGAANPQDTAPVDAEEKQFLERLESSRQLVRNLKVLFGQMTKGYKKYADPTQVLRSLTDDQGKAVEIGEEKDIGEFSDAFLSRVQEGLNYKKLYQDFLRE
jgi:ubiquitin carboxyl-terminal hydrolase 25/28